MLHSGPRVPTNSKTLVGVLQIPDLLGQKLPKDISLGRIDRPFLTPTLPTLPLRCSPLGLVPKKNGDCPHHLSYPHETSVNNFSDTFLSTVQYPSVDVAVDMIQRLGISCLLGKADVNQHFDCFVYGQEILIN